jgi:nicotinamide-nucleotide amidase
MIDRAVILSTGELTTGRVVDTNSTFIAGQLSSIGVDVAAVLKVGDDRQRLLWALREARELGDLVIGTGGLGPTADDLTTEIVAQFLDLKLHLNEEVAQSLKQRFAARGLTWTSNNLKQAHFPEGSIIVPNPLGRSRLCPSVGDRKTLIWLSGVPQEMTAMFNQTVLPWAVEQKGSNEKFRLHIQNPWSDCPSWTK